MKILNVKNVTLIVSDVMQIVQNKIGQKVNSVRQSARIYLVLNLTQ